jgi:hypothetical protein
MNKVGHIQEPGQFGTNLLETPKVGCKIELLCRNVSAGGARVETCYWCSNHV